MASAVMRKLSILAVLSSKGDDFGVESYEDLSAEFEYSFAVEYQGPPVGYEIPRAFPIDINQIPTAAPVSSASLLHSLSLPIIQPIAKSNQSKKGRTESKLEDEVKVILDSNGAETESSGELGSGSSEGELGLVGDGEEGDWGSTESGLSSGSVSSEDFSGRDEGGVETLRSPFSSRRRFSGLRA